MTEIYIDMFAPCNHTGLPDAEALPDYIISDMNLDSLIHEISMMGGSSIRLAADQWFAVVVDGEIESTKVHTFIQCDTILLGVTETYKQWLKVYKKITGVSWDD